MYLVYVSGGLAVVLSLVLFFTKNAISGWLSGIFWAVFAAVMYTRSSVPIGGSFDAEYGLMWGGIAGLIVCTLYSWSIGRDKDKDDEDELPDNTPYVDEERADRIKRIRQKGRNKRIENSINRRG